MIDYKKKYLKYKKKYLNLKNKLKGGYFGQGAAAPADTSFTDWVRGQHERHGADNFRIYDPLHRYTHIPTDNNYLAELEPEIELKVARDMEARRAREEANAKNKQTIQYTIVQKMNTKKQQKKIKRQNKIDAFRNKWRHRQKNRAWNNDLRKKSDVGLPNKSDVKLSNDKFYTPREVVPKRDDEIWISI